MGRRSFKKRGVRRSIRPPAPRPSGPPSMSHSLEQDELGESIGRGSSPALAMVHDLELSERGDSDPEVAGDDHGSHARTVPKEPTRSGPVPSSTSTASSTAALSIEGALSRVASEPPPGFPSASHAGGAAAEPITPEARSPVAPDPRVHPGADQSEPRGQAGCSNDAADMGPGASERGQGGSQEAAREGSGLDRESASSVSSPRERPSDERPSDERPSDERPSLDDLLTIDDGTHDFFIASTPPAPSGADSWLPPSPMSRESRQAMVFSIGLLLVSVLGIGGYLVYHKLIMPTPVALGGATPHPMGFESPSHPPVPPVAGGMQVSTRAAVARPVEPASAAVEELPVAPEHPALDAPAALPAGSKVDGPLDESQPGEGQGAPEALGGGAPAHGDSEDPNHAAAATAAPPHPSPADELAYRKRLDVAKALLKRHKHDEALAAYDEALGYWPQGPEALAKVAYLHLQYGRDAEARDYAQRAVASDPTDSEAWIVLGAAHQALREREAAMQAYRTCAEQASGRFVVECRRLAR